MKNISYFTVLLLFVFNSNAQEKKVNVNSKTDKQIIETKVVSKTPSEVKEKKHEVKEIKKEIVTEIKVNKVNNASEIGQKKSAEGKEKAAEIKIEAKSKELKKEDKKKNEKKYLHKETGKNNNKRKYGPSGGRYYINARGNKTYFSEN